MRTIEVVDYDPKWPELFKGEAKLLKRVFNKNMIWIEHIGSTAVPGLCAKPIIDILIGVRNILAVDRCQKKMEQLGYIVKDEFGVAGRRFFVKGDEENRSHHIHVFRMGNPNISRHINFKYYLISHPEWARRYGKLKKILANQFPHDIEGYIYSKESFIQKLDKKATLDLAKQVLETQRLKLRPLKLEDAIDIQRLFQDKSITTRMLHIPSPCDEEAARQWIAKSQLFSRRGDAATFALILKKNEKLIGSITLWINKRYQRAEFSYWVGKNYRNRGYCTEVAYRMIEFGFTRLGLNRIYAQHFATNPASGKVMQKLGMQYEGYFREHFKKWDEFKDSKQYAVLATDRWRKG